MSTSTVIPESWYAATLVFTSQIGEKRARRPLCEERVVLVRALSEAHAATKLNEIGTAEGHAYENVHGERVVRRFVGIECIGPVDPPGGSS